MRFHKTVFLIIGLLLASACATSSSKNEAGSFSIKDGVVTKIYKAYTLNFNGAGPGIVEQEFKSKVEINVRSRIRSYRFSNFISGQKEPDVVVVLAISGRTAGLAIYDASGAKLAEYTRGRARNDSVFFKVASKKGVARIKWFLGNTTIVSAFESYDNKGQLGASEITFYKAGFGGE
ncbi:hypothetical protein MNBD_NITROSPINAE04-302 [hydrothermal vent metagenome]|uniref:Lipoprotein n=1 Tax=hydrothermal vent metagenome TaxID=652676 RepID=A0A3B1CPL9_9ZZZZ